MNRQTILGATGIVGTELAKALAHYTDTIRFVSRQPRRVNLSDEQMSADLTDPQAIDRAVAGSEVVYVTIGFPYSAKVWQEQWPPFMEHVVAACERHGAKLVFFDNNYLYADGAMPDQTETSPVAPSSRKGAVRARVAQMVTDAVAEGRLTALIARSAEFYGPRIVQRSNLMELVYENFKRGKAANWFVNADQVHTFTYVPDAARATALLGNTPDAYGQVWHLPTTAERLTGRDWVALFARAMSQPNRVNVLPGWLMRVLGLAVPFLREAAELRFMSAQDYVFRSDKFTRRFGWSATPPAEAVRETVRLNGQPTAQPA